MSLHATQLAWDCAPGDPAIRVMDPTGLVSGHKVQIDSEYCRVAQGYQLGASVVPVLRGQDGTVTTRHRYAATVVFGDAVTDFAVTPSAGLPSDRPGAVPAALSTVMPFVGWTYPTALSPEALTIPLPTTVGLSLVHFMTGQAPYTLAAPTLDLTGTLLLLVTDQWPAQIVITNLERGGGNTNLTTLDKNQSQLLVALTAKWYQLEGMWYRVQGTLTVQ